MKKIGERIKKLRKERGMTQEQVGTILGVQKATVQKYEKGSVSNIKPETIEKIAEVFEVSPSYIMGWDDFDTKYDSAEMSKEIKLIEEISRIFGYVGVEFYTLISQMNDDGRRKVLFYAEDIFDKYKGEIEQ
ncbi:MAG: helix-turn-helix domain-containing protein [Bacteroidaceae bacterium]|nr:helix-turn-helix domain-containing protein [Bacteroidaceae bacterium]